MALVSTVLLILLYSGPEIKGQTLELISSPTEYGSSFTLICEAPIDTFIFFYLNEIKEATCQAPFGNIPGDCLPPNITQNINAGETSWTIPKADLSHEGNWTCRRQITDSAIKILEIYKCPNTTFLENGISSDLTLNDTSVVEITIETGCMYPPDTLEIGLLFKSESTELNSNMNCSATTTVCDIGTSYQCTHQIFYDMHLSNNGKFDLGKNYTLHYKASTRISDCNSVAIFDQYSLQFYFTGPTLQSQGGQSNKFIFISICGLPIIVIIVCCSNKNCKTYETCWCCGRTCYSNCPVVTNIGSKDWYIDCYCKRCCQENTKCNRCCCIFMCRGLCLKEWPAVRSIENGEPLDNGTEKKNSTDHDFPKETKDNTIHPASGGKVNTIKLPSINNRMHNSETGDTLTQNKLTVLPPIENRK